MRIRSISLLVITGLLSWSLSSGRAVAVLGGEQDALEGLRQAFDWSKDGRAGDALVHYTAVLRHDELNLTALAGQERAEAAMKRAWSGERLEAGNTAFSAGRYDDARRLFQYAFNLNAMAASAEGLRRVDNIQIFVDDRSLGVAADLELHVAGGRYRVRLETVPPRQRAGG